MRRLILTTVVALMLGACTVQEQTPTTPAPVVTIAPPEVVALPFALQPFNNCGEVLAYLKTHALEHVTPWGLDGVPWWGWMGGDVMMRAAEESAGGAASPPSYSTTNLQEVGVDEPDVVKTDGSRIVAIAQGRLHVVDVSGEQPILLGSLVLEGGWNHQLFLAGDTALVMAGEQGVMPLVERVAAEGIAPWWGAPTTVITEIDLSDPANPEAVRTLRVDGNLISSRMTGTTARVVVTSFPTGLEFVTPDRPGLRAEREAEAANRRVIEESTLADWMPYYVLEDRRRETTTEGTLLDCGRVTHPADYSGLSTLSILTIDLADGIEPGESFGLIADGSTVYGSTSSLYVATQRWIDWQAVPEKEIDESADSVRTVIHRFDISDPASVSYRASGEVPGYLLSQWSMSEHEGFLRVASTTESPWFGWRPGASQSIVTVLEEVDGRLTTVGQVDGLGKGERIYAVRFIDEVGYVVTFRQTDPLYTIDVSDPRNPTVAGELKIPGYSAYLHPIGDGLLLGVGQDADADGRTFGTQVSVFDVSDPVAPARLHKLTLKGGYSEAEWDHHAFLHWPATGLTVIPVQTYSWDGIKDQWFAGALALSAGRDGITELARIQQVEQAEWQAPIRRSIVIGEVLFTVSEIGVMASDLDGFEPLGWVEF